MVTSYIQATLLTIHHNRTISPKKQNTNRKAAMLNTNINQITILTTATLK